LCFFAALVGQASADTGGCAEGVHRLVGDTVELVERGGEANYFEAIQGINSLLSAHAGEDAGWPGTCTYLLPVIYNNLGVAQFLLGDGVTAIDSFNEALRFAPFDDMALRNRAWTVQASDHESNHLENVINNVYGPVLEVLLVRQLLHWSETGQAISYTQLNYDLLRHMGVVSFEETSVAGAKSWLNGADRLGRVFDLVMVHQGDGTVVLRARQQRCKPVLSEELVPWCIPWCIHAPNMARSLLPAAVFLAASITHAPTAHPPNQPTT
jgi:hypothetical protein